MRNEPSKSRSETSPVSPSLLVPATPQCRRAQNSLANKMLVKSFKRPSKPTYSNESLLEDAENSNIDGYTIVTVRDQSCSTTQLETLCPGNNGDCFEEEVQSIAKEEPSQPSPKPSLVERGSSAFIIQRKDQSTSAAIEQNYSFNEKQPIIQRGVSNQTEDEDFIVLKANCKKDRKQVIQAKPPTAMSTTSDFCLSEYNTDDNYYQTENNVEGLDDLVEEKEKLQNLMHLIPLTVTTTDYPSAFSKSSSSSTATSVPPQSKCSRAKIPTIVTVVPKTQVGFKPIDPRKLERCYKCKKCVLNSGIGNTNNGLDKSSSYYKSSMCSCAKPRIKKSVQSDKLHLKPPHPKYEVVSPSPVTSASQYNARSSKCERRSQRNQSLNANNSSRQFLIQPSNSVYDTNGNTIVLKHQSVEMSNSQRSAMNCTHKNSQETCTNAVIPVSLVTPEPNCDCATCTDESNAEKKHLVASCNFVFQFK